jgi:diguanylate cyclase (GGDEF)-like protein
MLPTNNVAVTPADDNLNSTSLPESSITSVISERVNRFPSYAAIWSITAGIFALYFLFQPDATAAFSVTITGIALNLFLIGCEKRNWISKHVATNLLLANSVIGITLLAVMTGHRESLLPMFFPIICLIAAHLLGIRAAISWFFLTTLAIYFSYFPPVSLDFQHTPTTFDKLFINLGIGFTVLWLCDQSERFFVKRTNFLESLTEQLQEQTRLLGLAEETAGVGHWHWNLENDEIRCSDELVRIFSIESNTELTIETLLDRFDEEHRSIFQTALSEAQDGGDSFTLELSFVETNQLQHVTCRGFSELDSAGKVSAIFGVVRDDTLLKEATTRLTRKANELKKLASFDPLTGLTNRFQFRRHLNRAVKYAHGENRNIALLVLDMDGFKEINDTLGHATGDLVLQETGKRIKECVSSGDVVSRLGGDEFTVILRDIKTISDVERVAERIVKSLRKPMQFDQTQLEVGASVGASLCPRDAGEADELFTFADTAMYDAKFNGKDVAMYDPKMTEELVNRKRVESKLVNALDRDEFHVVYQPQYNVAKGHIVGFEALIRWEKEGVFISPLEFIPLLESSGQIIEVGKWILAQACEQCSRWNELGYRTRVAVNISPVQFRDPQFVNLVLQTMQRYKLDPSLLDLEITEGLLISDVAQAADTLNQLKSLGCMISVDDFGTGYSSLAYLKNFPIDQLKIDRAFIKDMPEHDDGTIAASIVVLGLSLDMEVLAEGVETLEQLEFLKSHDCHSFQGNFASLPVDPETCETLLSNAGILKGAASGTDCDKLNRAEPKQADIRVLDADTIDNKRKFKPRKS